MILGGVVINPRINIHLLTLVFMFEGHPQFAIADRAASIEMETVEIVILACMENVCQTFLEFPLC
jgi:hypothetical protein